MVEVGFQQNEENFREISHASLGQEIMLQELRPMYIVLFLEESATPAWSGKLRARGSVPNGHGTLPSGISHTIRIWSGKLPLRKCTQCILCSSTRLLCKLKLVWLVPLAQVWTHYKIGKLNMWTLFCNVCIDFLNSQIWKGIMLELKCKPSSVTTFSTDFSFQNLVFWNLFEFLVAVITSKSMSFTT